MSVQIGFADDARAAMLAGGDWRSMLATGQWQALVIPTLSKTASFGMAGLRLNVLRAVTIKAADAATFWQKLRQWAAEQDYQRLDIVEVSRPMTDDERQMVADLQHAVWPTPPPTFDPPPGKAKPNPLLRP